MTMHTDRDLCRAADELSRKLGAWRKTHHAPSPIPAHLWELAAVVASEQGVCKTSRQFRLNYQTLKERVAVFASKPPKSLSGGSQFHELSSALVLEKPAVAARPTFVELLSPLAGNIGACTLEVESPRGARLRVQMKDVTPLDLATLIRDFTR